MKSIHGQLLAGFGSADITPDLGMPLFAAHRVREIHEKILARVIYLEQVDGEEPVILAMADIPGFDRMGDRRIREAVSQAVGVDPDRIRLNASHNHSCCNVDRGVQKILDEYGLELVSAEWMDRVEVAIVQAALEARNNRQAVAAFCGMGEIYGLAASRSVELADGRVQVRLGHADAPESRASWTSAPTGLIDPHVTVLCLKSEDDEPIVTLVNFACHDTAMKWSEGSVGPGIFGHASKRIEQETGGHAFFLQGACGNISPGKFADGSLETTRSMGDHLAEVVLRIMEGLTPCPDAPLRLTSWRERVELRSDLPPPEEIRKLLRSAKDGTAWRLASMLNVAENLEAANLDLFVLRVGDWQIVGYPAEFFVEGALAVRAVSRTPFTFVGAYYDCTLWYIPTIPALRRGGGYETSGDWNYTAPGAAEQIVQAVIRRIE